MNESTALAGALQTEQIVGRQKERNDIEQAVQAEGELRILYIVGDGGIGKTRLLQEVPSIVAKLQGQGAQLQYGGLWDLHQPSIQSGDGLESVIAEALEPEGHAFDAYRATRQDLDRARAAGSDPREIEKLRHSVERAFVLGFNEISARTRVVLALDTVEAIQYESDVVQQACQIELTGLEVRDWLLTNLTALRNAVIIMAGREKRQLRFDFERYFDDRLRVISLGPFAETDTLSYFDAITKAMPALQHAALSAERQKVIHHYTGGFPLKIALVIELLARNLPLPREFLDSLETAELKGAAERADIQQRVEKELIAGILTAGDDTARVLPYVALASKGMDGELLGRLTGWPEARVEKVLNVLGLLSFTKVRPGSTCVFLHDEMYDLMERHAWSKMEQEREEVCRVILEYYEERLAQAREPSVRQDLLVDQLYYQFLVCPENGYAEYARLSDAALFDHNIGFDMRLRDVMLQFYERYPTRFDKYGVSRTFVDFDAAVRWVKRYVRVGRYDQAVKIARSVEVNPHLGVADTPDLALAQGELDVYHALALVYTGEVEAGISRFKTVLAYLEGMSTPTDLAYYRAGSPFAVWRRNLVLGLAHNNLGYAYRTRLGRYKAALQEFRMALPYFLTADLQELVANVSDNAGRVYGLLGARTRAELLVTDGLERRRRLGHEFRIGLSLNSRAILHLEFGEAQDALRVGGEALRIFERIGAQRGIGLACITVGQSMRQRGAQWKMGMYTIEECDGFLLRSSEYLRRAAEIFPNIVNEPIRQVEVLNELGCFYRERAALLRVVDAQLSSVAAEYAHALDYLNRAKKLAQSRGYKALYVDCCEDLAQTYYQAHDFRVAEDSLTDGEGEIPPEYKIKKGRGLKEAPEEEEAVEEFWRQMGKIEVMRGHLILAQDAANGVKSPGEGLTEAVQHYAFAGVYLERYSGRVVSLRTVLGELYDHFKGFSHRDLSYAQDQILPKIAEEYWLDMGVLRHFFEDTLELALLLAT